MAEDGASLRVDLIAALYVEKGGVYDGLPDVELWDEARDARLYDGPWPVVAHPPCARWCQLAGLVGLAGLVLWRVMEATLLRLHA